MKFKDQFKFTPEAKFVFAVNMMPRVDDSSSATERRICVVQFNNNFRDNPNTMLRFADGVLASELPGILNWMLEGYRSLIKEGKFVGTVEQVQTLAEYREENSSVDGFIAECLDFKADAIETSSKLYGEYKDYCMKDGRKFKSMIAFTKEMKAYGKRTGKFVHIERSSGHSTGFFKGAYIATKWDSEFAQALPTEAEIYAATTETDEDIL